MTEKTKYWFMFLGIAIFAFIAKGVECAQPWFVGGLLILALHDEK